MFYEVADLIVALGGDDAPAAGGDLLYVAQGLFALEVAGVLGSDANHGERLVDEGVGAGFHLASGVWSVGLK